MARRRWGARQRGSGGTRPHGKRRDKGRGARARVLPVLLCALTLSSLGILLVSSQQVSAAAQVVAAQSVAARPQDTASDTATDTPTDTPTPTATNTPAPPTATPTTCGPYVLDPCVLQATKYAGWPQSNGNWCGIATIAAIEAFLNPGTTVSQNAIFNALNSDSAASEWGFPPRPDPPSFNPPYYGPYLAADISGDFGTDPRSIAEGLILTTGAPYRVIVDTASAYNATINIIDAMVNTHQPISVIVDHGQHSVLVTGVDTKGGVDPRSNPGAITGIHVFDPGYNPDPNKNVGIQQATEEDVSLTFWVSGHFTDGYNSSYFADPYSTNIVPGTNKALDPDPSVGPYTYVHSRYNHLWAGYWVWAAPSAAGPSVDWEINQNGALIAGMDSSGKEVLPAGYTGASIAMPTNVPPPPPPVKVVKAAPPPPLPPAPKPTPTPKPTATPLPTITPAPTATFFATPAPVKKQNDCSFAGCVLGSVFGNVTPETAVIYGALVLVGVLLLLMGFIAQARARRSRRKRQMRANKQDPYAGVPVVPVLTPQTPDGSK